MLLVAVADRVDHGRKRRRLVPQAASRPDRPVKLIKESGLPFGLPPEPERARWLDVVLHVLYLIFNEGYVSTQDHVCTASSCRPRRFG